MTSNFTKHVTAAICAVLFSATLVLSAVGPIVNETPEVAGTHA